MTTNDELIETIGGALRAAQQVMIVSHVRPDGDAIGSLLGLGLSLREIGKNVQMVLVDGVPTSLRFMKGSETIVRQPKGNFDLRVVVDCSDLQRTGLTFEKDAPPELNIDHHITNLEFARLNLVEPEEVATSALLAKYLPEWGLPITSAVAENLLTGIVSDTLGFRTSNTNPQSLRLAADLVEKGADLPELYNLALTRRSFEAARFWALGLDQMQRDDGLVWTSLRIEDRNKVNYPGNDDADLINFMSTIDDCPVAIIFVEQKEGNIKVSWRSQPGWDVSNIALRFGGGGHPAASGAVISGTLEQVQEQVLRETRTLLLSSPGNNGSHLSA